MTNRDFLDPLVHFLKIPSISTQESYLGKMAEGRHFLIDFLVNYGFKTNILKGVNHDAVFASRIINKKLPTVLIYGHYDVQPPDPLDQWKSDPFNPVIVDGNIVARGAADNKGQIMIHLMAVAKLISVNGNLPVNFKFIIEGEEELGSPSIKDFTQKYKDLLNCDYLIVSDTGMPKRGHPAIDISLRGLLYTEISIETGKHDLHSGTFGGVAENPAILLSRLISHLKDDKGIIKIPGFYNDVVNISAHEQKSIRANSETKEDIIAEGELYGINGGEGKYSIDERKWVRPTLDVNGMISGYTGEGSKTIIPAKASAKISMRLVPNQNPDEIYKSFCIFVKKQFPKFVKVDIKKESNCLTFQAEIDHPVFKVMGKSLKKVFGKDPIYKRVSGSIGAVPLLADALRVPCLLVGFDLPGSNLHAPNERFNLDNYYKGIEAMYDFYSQLPNGNFHLTNK